MATEAIWGRGVVGNLFDDALLPLLKYLEAYALKDRDIGIMYDGPFPHKYLFDPDGVRQALYNVMSNAIKYSYRRGRDVEIIGTCIPQTEWRIAVRDWGIGVPEKERDRVFRKFGYCSNARAHDNTGLGLGAYMAKRIIELHQGSPRGDASEGPDGVHHHPPIYEVTDVWRYPVY